MADADSTARESPAGADWLVAADAEIVNAHTGEQLVSTFGDHALAERIVQAMRAYRQPTGPRPRVAGCCPSCRGSTSLFLGAGGHVTCSRLDCPDPGAVDDQLHAEPADGQEDCTDGHAVGCRHIERPEAPLAEVREIPADALTARGGEPISPLTAELLQRRDLASQIAGVASLHLGRALRRWLAEEGIRRG